MAAVTFAIMAGTSGTDAALKFFQTLHVDGSGRLFFRVFPERISESLKLLFAGILVSTVLSVPCAWARLSEHRLFRAASLVVSMVSAVPAFGIGYLFSCLLHHNHSVYPGWNWFHLQSAKTI